MPPSIAPARPSALPPTAAAAAGLLMLWIGCSLTNAPLPLGGPMPLSFNAMLGVPLLCLGMTCVAFAASRARLPAWPLAATVALATAGVNFWRHLPIHDGAFHALRTGVMDPDRWPTDAVLHTLALAPVGLALAAMRPAPRRVATRLLASAVSAIVSGLALEAFAAALPRDDRMAALVLFLVPSGALLATLFGRLDRSAGGAVAGQAAVLLALCLILWVEWRRVT